MVYVSLYFSSLAYLLINCYLITRLLGRRDVSAGACAAAMAVMAAVISAANVFALFYGFSAVVAFFMLFIYSALFLNGRLSEKILIPAVCVALQGATDMLAMLIMKLVLKAGFWNIHGTALYNTVGTLLSIVLFAVAVVRLSRLRWSMGLLNARLVAMLSALPIACFIMIMLFQKHSRVEDATSPFMLLAALSLVSIAFFTLIMFNELSKNMGELVGSKVRLQAAENRLALQKDIEAIYSRLLALKHDMKNHLLSIKALLVENEVSGAIDYISKLTRAAGSGYRFIDTGNPIMDSIINTKAVMAANENIHMTVEASIPKLVTIEEVDICSIFGNMLDNAIEASRQLPDEQRKIELRVEVIKDYLSATCINNTCQSPERDGQLYKTTKESPDEHGFGLKHMLLIARKYDGDLHCECEGGRFLVQIMLNIPQNHPGDYCVTAMS